MSATILYIEDNHYNVELTRKMLKVMNYLMLEAHDGQTGFNLAVCDHPDLILLDMGLPDIGGLDVLRQLQLQMPVIVLTVDATDTTHRACLEAGCNAYLTKPVSRSTLLKTVTQFVPSVVR